MAFRGHRRYARPFGRRARIAALSAAILRTNASLDPATVLQEAVDKRQTPAFDAAQTVLKGAVDTRFAQAERELAAPSDKAREAKALRSLVNHRTVRVRRPAIRPAR